MANGHGTELTAEGAADTKMMSPEELLEHEALSQEEENDRLRQEIQALEAELAQPFEEDERVKKGSRRLRQIELNLAGVEATLSVMAQSRPSPRYDPLFARSDTAITEDAYEHLVETVKGLEEAVTRAELRKSEEEGTLERDTAYLHDNEAISSQLQDRLALGADLPRPDGREFILRAKRRLNELDHRFDLLESGLGALIDVLADETQYASLDPRWSREAEQQADETLEGGSPPDIRSYLRGNDVDATARVQTSRRRVDTFKALLETLLTRSLMHTAGQLSPAATATESDSGNGSGFFAVSAPDELVDFVVRSEIAEEAPQPQREQRTNGEGMPMPVDQDEMVAKRQRRIRLVEVGVRIDL